MGRFGSPLVFFGLKICKWSPTSTYKDTFAHLTSGNNIATNFTILEYKIVSIVPTDPIALHRNKKFLVAIGTNSSDIPLEMHNKLLLSWESIGSKKHPTGNIDIVPEDKHSVCILELSSENLFVSEDVEAWELVAC